MFDVLIKDGFILDGLGNPWFRGDVGIKGENIVRVGRISESEADRVIDAKGLFVSPGFIDMHTHHDLSFFKDPRLLCEVMQGVTTVVTGCCGFSPFPLNRDSIDLHVKHLSPFTPKGAEIRWDWSSLEEFRKALEGVGIGVNVAPLIGHGTIRLHVMGYSDCKASERELSEMAELVEREMLNGAFGMSTGLHYSPAVFSDTNELIELCKVVAKHGGIFSIHLRNETDRVVEAVEEALEIASKSGVSLQISHLKSHGQANWHLVDKSLKLIEEAREKGVEVNCDVYPYDAAMTYLSTLLPPWLREGGTAKAVERLKNEDLRLKAVREMSEGSESWDSLYAVSGWDRIVIAYSKNFPEFEGKTIREISAETCLNPFDVIFKIIESDLDEALMILHTMSEEKVEEILKNPVSMMGSDSWLIVEGKPHPRVYGSAVRVISRFVKERRSLRLEEAIRKMTSLPATKLRIWDRGVIRPGFKADIVVFDYEELRDTATFDDPASYPRGVKYVLVNGSIVVEEGVHTGVLNGRVLTRRE